MPQASPTAQNYDYSRFTSNDYLEFSTSLTDVLFCTLPPTSIVPGSQGRVASSTRDIEFEGPLDPQLLEGSFFDPQSQNTFKAFLQKEIVRGDCFRGFQSMSFQFRVENSEGDSQDSILTNVINPVIEAIQGLAPDGYRIMVATHASQKPPDGESGESAIVDHVIFAVPNSSWTTKGIKYDLHSHEELDSNDSSRWKALAIIECKGFNMISPEEYDPLFAENFQLQTRESIERLRSFNEDNPSNSGSTVPQARRYSYYYSCDNIILSDHSHSVALSIPSH